MTDADKLALIKRLSDAIYSIVISSPLVAHDQVEKALAMLAPHADARMRQLAAQALKAPLDEEVAP